MNENQILYSSLVTERLAASSKGSDELILKSITAIKPYYWFGSANAWLVFLGSSPGGSPSGGKIKKSDYPSEISFNKTINHLLNYKDTNGFWNKIRSYSRDVFPNIPDDDLYKVIMAGNLVDDQQGNSKKLINEELQKGAADAFKALSIIRPKLVICLQESVRKPIYDLAPKFGSSVIQEDHVLKVDAGIKRPVVYKVPVTYFESIDELWGKWILTKTPMHPSRSNFCNQTNFKEQFLQKLLPLANKYFGL
jgi:hypothetical protein